MRGQRLLFVTLILRICRVSGTQTLLQEAWAKVFGSAPTYSNVRTSQLLNQLCNESQGDAQTLRDACYGCFFRASNKPSGYPMLLGMASCADLYLADTEYGHCQVYLRNATNTVVSGANPTTIYCTFLECIRQVNKDALIRTCLGEAIGMFPSFDCTDLQLTAQVFVNTTACILAKTRHGVLNPITGAVQEEAIASPLVNAILVNSDYDINIVQLPFTYDKVDECAKYRNVHQACWPGVDC
ncbi:uncharacterized protein LOC105701600 [Orussus abietinus]|uniref:uncharacterized protein LOC105701600 n=1 Tax=Orussus abietinus TaxID=222816 RepID=UPI0006253775|nr:uncharacterized protein LOC105701600 [Orussus abietinus]